MESDVAQPDQAPESVAHGVAELVKRLAGTKGDDDSEDDTVGRPKHWKDQGASNCYNNHIVTTLNQLALACQDNNLARKTVWESGAVFHITQLLSSQNTSPSTRAAASLVLWYLSRCTELASMDLSKPSHTDLGPLPPDMELAHALVAGLEHLGHVPGEESDAGAYACMMALNNVAMQRPSMRICSIQAGAVVQLAGESG